MMPARIILICFCLLAACAAQAQDLYSGLAEVEDQSLEQRNAALPVALGNVLQKLSGLQNPEQRPGVSEALSGANRMVVAFQYQQMPGAGPDSAENERTLLVVKFLPPAVDSLMRELQLPRWNPRRDPVLLWVLVDDGPGVQLQPIEYQYAWDYLEQSFLQRGLPVSWPGLSEDMVSALDVENLWFDVVNPQLYAVSGNAALSIIRARRDGPEWLIDWAYREPLDTADSAAPLAVTPASTEVNEPSADSLVRQRRDMLKTGRERSGAVYTDENIEAMNLEEDTGSWQTLNTNLLLALDEGVQRLVSRIARRDSLGAAGQGQWMEEILVTQLGGERDYARLLAYLDTLTVVDGFSVMGVGPEGLTLALTLNAEPDFLLSSFRSDGQLQVQEIPGRYRLVSAQGQVEGSARGGGQ